MKNLGDFLTHDRLGQWIELIFGTDRDNLPHKIYLSGKPERSYQTFRFLPKLGAEMSLTVWVMGKAFLFASHCHAIFVEPIQREKRCRLKSALFIFEVKDCWQIKKFDLINFSCKFCSNIAYEYGFLYVWSWLIHYSYKIVFCK